MLGKLLDRRYQVTQVLGAGGFGKTYLAQDTRRPGNPICVVKQLKPVSSETGFLETARRLFTSEGETLEQLGSHDQIPRLLAYFEEDHEFFLVQEFIEGHTLTQEMQPGQRWEEGKVIELLIEVLSILEFVHNRGVIHRDIKPDNLIRRNSDNKLVLVDFGAVKQINTQLATAYGQAGNTVAVGTPGYMASEQARGQPRPSSDIYALGIIGVQALTGMMPMQMQEDLNTGEILWEHLVSTSRGLVTIINRMIRYHFKERYQSATEALQALQQLNAPYKPLPQSVPVYNSQPPLPVNPVPASSHKLPQPNYPPSQSDRRTLPVSPAKTYGKSVTAPPDDVIDPQSHNLAPIIISMALVGGLFGMAFALRPNSFASLFGGARNNQTIDVSQRSCTVITDTLNVRSKPGTDNAVVGNVYKGNSLKLTGVSRDGWVEISSPTNGWVSNNLINCNSTKQAPIEAKATPTPVETPQPKPSAVVKPKPTVDKGSDKLAKADEKYQNGDLEGAIAKAKEVIDSGSASAKDAQEKIVKWQKDYAEAKAKYDRVEKALNEGRWDEVIKESVDPKLLQQSYWREKLNQLIEEAKKQKAAAEAEAKKGATTPPENPQPSKPNSQSTESGKPSQQSSGGTPVTP